jgi:hypothetical protein
MSIVACFVSCSKQEKTRFFPKSVYLCRKKIAYSDSTPMMSPLLVVITSEYVSPLMVELIKSKNTTNTMFILPVFVKLKVSNINV